MTIKNAQIKKLQEAYLKEYLFFFIYSCRKRKNLTNSIFQAFKKETLLNTEMRYGKLVDNWIKQKEQSHIFKIVTAWQLHTK